MMSTVQTPLPLDNEPTDQHCNNVAGTGNSNCGVSTWRQKFRAYPKSVFFIFGNECCERFSFYGMRAILVIYFMNVLNYNQNDATALFNAFNAVAFFLPLLGAILADGFIGRYHTIFWVSLVYAAGSITLAVASASSSTHPWLDWIGLLLICIGTGGIKPCVIAFGGDQFKKGQEKWLSQYFAVFYFCINLGALISTFITPIFRTFHCGGQCSCYPLAFGIPAVLMILATVTFVSGTHWYDRKPVKDKMVMESAKIFYYAIVNRFRFSIKKDHWLEHALDHHVCAHDRSCVKSEHCRKAELVRDLRWLLRLLVIYIPLPFFFAVTEQSGARWIIQGTQMNGRLGSWNFLPDQVPGIVKFIDPFVILVGIPILSFGIYPFIEKFVKVTPLRKMSAGGIFYTAGFFFCAFIQLKINDTLPLVPKSGRSRLEVVNYARCGVTVSLMQHNGSSSTIELDVMQSGKLDLLALNSTYIVQPWSNDTVCKGLRATGNFSANSRTAYYAIIALVYDFDFKKPQLKTTVSAASLQKAENGEGEFVLNTNYLLPDFAHTQFTGYTISVGHLDARNDSTVRCNDNKNNSEGVVDSQTLSTPYVTMAPGRWDVFLQSPDGQKIHVGSFNISDQGAIYTLTLYGDNVTSVADLKELVQLGLYTLASPNSVGLLWQVPQYLMISIGELLLAVTLYEFSFSQAPPSMKSVLQATNLICLSIGNLVGVPLAEVPISNNAAYLMFALAGMVAAVVIAFICLAYFCFEYVNVDEEKPKAAHNAFAAVSQDNVMFVEHY